MEEIGLKKRIKSAIIILESGNPFTVNDFTLRSSDNIFHVFADSESTILENITKDSAAEELQKIKETFFIMLQNSNELKRFVGDKEIEFNLDFNYGMGSLKIANEKQGRLNWQMNFKQ